jgi:hypothetical protein
VLGNLDRSRFAAGMDDLRPAPLGNLASRRLAVVAGETETLGGGPQVEDRASGGALNDPI